MKTSKRIGISVVTIAVIMLIVYRLYDVKQHKKDDIDRVNQAKSEVTVTATAARSDTVKIDIVYHGKFEPFREVTVVSEAQGKVKKQVFDEGDFISEGDTIACLDNDLTGYQLETAKATYLKAQDELRRFENLSPGEAVSTQQLEEIKLAFINAKADWLTIKKQYENSFIKAPVSGTMSKRYFEKGSFVAAGSPVSDLVDTRKMKFNAWFTATDLTRIKTGQKVRLETGLYPGVSYEGTIRILGVKPDDSGRYLVQAEVENDDKRPLVSGIDGALSFEYLPGKKSIVIPRNCIVGSAIQPMVYVVRDGTAQLRTIVISEIINDRVIVEGGLSEGECVVLSGQINLEDHVRVTVLNDQNF